MQEEILLEYEKIKDQLSEEEFLKELEAIRESHADLTFMDDVDFAKMVLENHGIVTKVESSAEEESSFEDESDDESSFVELTEMTDEIYEIYQEVENQVSKEEFLSKMNEQRKLYGNVSVMGDDAIANMVKGEYVTEKVEALSDMEEHALKNIDDLSDGNQDVSITGRVMTISNPKTFTTRNGKNKGKKGKVCNVEIADNTGNIRMVLWTRNMPLLKKFNEGDIVKFTGADIRDGFSGLEANLSPRSQVEVLTDVDESQYPDYQQDITPISEIQDDTKVNIIARIVRIPTVRTYEKNGKEGQVASLELQDESGKISYTLWNKNVDLIDSLDLHDGDSIKILAAQARERNGEISLTHWDGRIIKGDFDVPEVTQEISQIGNLSEEKDVSILGVVSKLQDIRTFVRKADNSEGKLRNFDVMDESGSIRVTVWGDDTQLPINKGDIIKIIGGDVRFDDYTSTGYSMNTNFNTQITVNPTNLSEEELMEFEKLREELVPVKIGQIEEIPDDGVEIDVVGRLLSINEPNEFQRDDGSVGIVKSGILADESGKVQLSFWNEKAEEDFEVGQAYRVENARTRLGMYNVDLNVGSGSRVIKLTEMEADAMYIPLLSTLEKMIYSFKKLDEIEDEDEENLILIGRVIEIYEGREFERDNGDNGFVRNIEIADDTLSMRVVLWDKDAKREFELGQAIKFQNPRILFNDDHLEISVSRSTTILDPSEDELENLPSYDELKEAIYVPKTIETLADDDVNVRVTGKLTDISGDRILLKKCPNCDNTIEQSDDEFICDFCGEPVEEPKYLLMIPAKLEDETGEIPLTFFDRLAEELIGMKKEEIIDLVEDGYGIEDKVEDLNGLTVEIIANVSFDSYNERNKLNPKKILSKYY